MPIAEYEVEVDLDPARAWEKLRDFSAADNYVQGLTAVEITTESGEGVGASRRVYQGKRLALDETVTEWDEGQGFTIRLHRGEKGPVPPMSEAWFDYRLRQRDGKVYLHNSMRYEVGLGVLGRWLDRVAVNKVVSAAVRDTTIGQKIYYETGRKVTAEILKQARAELADG
jgi:hypothetical protein